MRGLRKESWFLRSGAALALLLLAGGCASVSAGDLWQPVTDYSLSFAGDRPGAATEINPFENFTHFGGDFGWMGPGQERIGVDSGNIRISEGADWTGVWHSLAGLATENDRVFDPMDLTGIAAADGMRCPVDGVTVIASGKGRMKLDLVSPSGATVWTVGFDVRQDGFRSYRFPLNAGELEPIKFLNWVAEPGSSLSVSAIGFQAARPEMDAPQWLFRTSLGKLRRCVDPSTRLARDRAHAPAGSFDCVPASGLAALASAAAAREGIIDPSATREEVRLAVSTILSLPRAKGLLPHFVSRDDGGEIRIHPGTEFSTVDTAITYHALLLAARMLDLADLSRELGKAVAAIDFSGLTRADGSIHHGLHTDGRTLIVNTWEEWGGETALIIMLRAMASPDHSGISMNRDGRIFRDCGFIGEIQSLFHPDFDRPEPDLLTGVNWKEARAALLLRQKRYLPKNYPDSAAAAAGLWGISAGESGMPGDGYAANGSALPGVRWLKPHYMVMSSALSDRASFVDDIGLLEKAGLLFPRGLPENVEITLKRHNPMQGSLNAGLEALASYHGWRRGGNDHIDRASLSDPLIRQGMSVFYP